MSQFYVAEGRPVPGVQRRRKDMKPTRLLQMFANQSEPSYTVVCDSTYIDDMEQIAEDLVRLLRNAARRDFAPTLQRLVLQSARWPKDDEEGFDIIFLQKEGSRRLDFFDENFLQSLPRTRIVAPTFMEMPRRMKEEMDFMWADDSLCCNLM